MIDKDSRSVHKDPPQSNLAAREVEVGKLVRGFPEAM
jgi:hypothetical protein